MDNEYQPLISNVSGANSAFTVFTGKGYLNNIFVNSHTSGVISLGNGTSSVIGSLKHSSITVGSAEREIKFHGEVYEDGLILNLANTASLTVQYRKN